MVLEQIRKEYDNWRRSTANCLCVCGCSEVLWFIKIALILCSLYHVIGHVMVLFGLFSIHGIEDIGRKLYFSFDLMVSLSCWIVTQRNGPMVLLHALIHIGAVGHLLEIIPTRFFDQIFEMGELDFDNKEIGFIVFYIWGTTQDICNHLLNIYHLTNTKRENNYLLNAITKIVKEY